MTTKIAIASSALPPGTRLGEFELTGVVGEGGFGIVYSAQDTTLERIVAIKEYLPSAFASRAPDNTVKVRSDEHSKTFHAGLASFINEAKMLAKFAHPGLVEVFRFWEGNGTAYMAMRYYRGVTLRDTIRNDPNTITEEWLCQTLDPILLALRELHAEQCFHRDIAPDNIMVLPNGKSVLMDFGAARRIIGGMTRALTTVLKPGYAPIEQYSDDGAMQQGAWTDIYALGGVLYHAMTGKVPVQAISRMMADPLKEVGSMARGAYSANLCNAVTKCLAVMPENRYQSIDELRTALGWVTTPVSSTVILSSPQNLPPRTQAITPAPSAVSPPASSVPKAIVASTSLDPLANLGKAGNINDLVKKTPVPASSDLDEITVVGAKAPKQKPPPAKPAASAKTASAPLPPASGPVTVSETTAQTAKKGLSAGLLVGGGLALIVAALAAFFITGRSSTPPKPVEPRVADLKPTPPPPAPAPPAPAPVEPPPAPAPAPSTPDVKPRPDDPGSTALPNTPVNPGDGKTDAPAVPDTGILRVTVTGGWAAISVNGEPKGTTPRCCSLKLPPGTYTVEFSNPNQPKVTKTVEVIAGKTVTSKHGY
jgi:serine/threonine protein kinase